MFPLECSQYELDGMIGAGSASVVYRAKCLANSETVCVKQIDLDNSPIDVRAIKKQTAFWSKCSHCSSIVNYIGAFCSGSKVWVVSEFMDGGSLGELLKFGYSTGIRDEAVIATIAHEVLTALAFLHENHEIHRDVRSSSILVNAKGECKLGDFGLATSLVKGGERTNGSVSMYGDTCYMAPEVLTSKNGYSEKSDIWALGLTLIEIATGKMPYDGMKFMESLVQIIDHDPPKLPAGTWTSQFRDFVNKCLVQDPELRATARELLEHKFMKNAQSAKYLSEKLMVSLPPLNERFEVLHGKSDAFLNAKSACCGVKFDFLNMDNVKVEEPCKKKNRFTITRKSTGKEAVNSPETNEHKMTRLNDEIQRLRALLKQLEEENSGLHQQVRCITDQVAALSR